MRHLFILAVFCTLSLGMDVNKQELVKKYQGLSLEQAAKKIDHGIVAQKLLKVTILLNLYGSQLSQQDKDDFLSWAFQLLPDVVPLLIEKGADNELALAKKNKRIATRA